MKFEEYYCALLDLGAGIQIAFDTALQYAECEGCSHHGTKLLNNKLYCEENCKEHEV